MRLLTVFALMLAVLGGCSTYRDHLNRGQRLYDENNYEQALAIWRALEYDMDSLDEKDQARYAYLRGMTDYRLKFRSHARHWLALARAIDEMHPGGLTEDWKRRTEEALADLNAEVYGTDRAADSETLGVDDKIAEPGELAPAEPAAPAEP